MHDTNRNTLNPANIAERNMRGNKEDKSRPPLPKPDEENVDSSKTEERKRKCMVLVSSNNYNNDKKRGEERVTRLSIKRPKMKNVHKRQRKI